MRHIGYLRVSTISQVTDRQLHDVGVDFHKTFEDKASGSSINNRPQFVEMLDYLQENDTVHIQSNDRCFRNVKEMLGFVEDMLERKINIRLHTENLHFVHDGNEMMLAQSKLMLTQLAAFSEFFLTQNRVAIKQGIKAAKAKGTLFGSANPKYKETHQRNKAAGLHKTPVRKVAQPELLARIRQMVSDSNNTLTQMEMTVKLNAEGWTSARGKALSQGMISKLLKEL
ncbi:recombinase [Vibrio phage 1.187.O._10N.286.49.F1]|nr:recombinase [Vibrio phage 1.187.O._10N.286.49.F1]